MKKTLAIILLLAFTTAIISSCSASRRGCPTTNPKYFRA